MMSHPALLNLRMDVDRTTFSATIWESIRCRKTQDLCRSSSSGSIQGWRLFWKAKATSSLFK